MNTAITSEVNPLIASVANALMSVNASKEFICSVVMPAACVAFKLPSPDEFMFARSIPKAAICNELRASICIEDKAKICNESIAAN